MLCEIEEKDDQLRELMQKFEFVEGQQISSRAHVKNYQKIIENMKDIEIKFLKIKLSKEYKSGPLLKDAVDSLDISLYAMK